MAMIPTITQKKFDGKEYKDLFSLLLEQRIIILFEEITPSVASLITAELLYLQAMDKDKPITFYLNSPGGSVYDGLAIYDMMKKISCPIYTIGFGLVASMAAVLLSAGSKGKRFALPHTEIMIHQPLGGSSGQVSDMEIMTKRFLYLRDQLESILVESTGQTKEKIAADTNRDYFLNALEAKEYGLIDGVLSINPTE